MSSHGVISEMQWVINLTNRLFGINPSRSAKFPVIYTLVKSDLSVPAILIR